MNKLSRRRFLHYGSGLAAATMLPLAKMPLFASEGADMVRDRLWVWGHLEGSYDNQYGLPMNSRITPLQGAEFLGIPNIIMVRYGNKPVPPYDEYAAQYRNVKKLMWSFVGDGGRTSPGEQEHVLELTQKMPNITGVFMDDFFHGNGVPTGAPVHHWLAKNEVSFPVIMTFHFEKPIEADRLELSQSAWRTGDYRTSDVAVDLYEGDNWKEIGTVCLENREYAKANVALPNNGIKALRLRILGTHDTYDALSVGLSGIRFFQDNRIVDLSGASIEASSSFPGYPPENLLLNTSSAEPEAPASISVARLKEIKKRMAQLDRTPDLGVVVYAHQLNPAIRRHLDLCDLVSFWSWTADDLAKLPENFAKYQEIVPRKRTLLGIYMWDFGQGKPLPMDLMKMQCDTALKWLKDGTIEGMIFLATNICDMKIEAVEWAKNWIAEHGATTI